MKQKEINYIGEELYAETQKSKRNGEWTRNDLEAEQALYKELKALGFDFYWHMQLGPTCFTKKDRAVIPIFIKYYHIFDDVGLKRTRIACLGVKGFGEAVDFLLNELKKV